MVLLSATKTCAGVQTMAKILDICVDGVRSFGVGRPQVVAFGSPLTLILGQNGCGKTVIKPATCPKFTNSSLLLER